MCARQGVVWQEKENRRDNMVVTRGGKVEFAGAKESGPPSGWQIKQKTGMQGSDQRIWKFQAQYWRVKF